ncbi:MAG: DUF6797 domain-containing protein [Rubripirellula sp.]
MNPTFDSGACPAHLPLARILTGTLLLISCAVASAQGPELERSLLNEPVSDLAADAREKGDAKRGALLFHSPGIGCAKCHANQLEDGFGPNLSLWRRKVDDYHIVDSVLRPSAHIQPEYRNLRVLTSDGRTFIGIQSERTDRELILKTGPGPTQATRIAINDIEAEKLGEVSLMPSGQVNALRRRQEFLDLIAYLIAIRDGGSEVASQLQPPPEALRLRIPEYESKINHKGMIADWNRKSLKRGQAIYQGLCVNCHGTVEKAGSLPTSLRFASGKFKFGNDPYAMYQTLTHGGGLMVPQTWMVPQQKYDVIQYIREHFLRAHNPSQYAEVSEAYLASLPRGDSRGPEPKVIEPWTTMDYGPMLTTTIEFGSDGTNIAQKAIAIRLDAGPGGVARGSAWMAFEHDTLRMAAAWTRSFVDWNGIQFNGRHGVHLHANGDLHAANRTAPGWANPTTQSFEDTQRVVGRDGRSYGPLPSTWGKFHGLHRYENRIVLSYSVGETPVLESPTVELVRTTPTFVRTLNLGPRPKPLKLAVMDVPRDATLSQQDGFIIVKSGDKQIIAAAPNMNGSAFRLADGRLVLELPAGDSSIKGAVWFSDSAIDAETRRDIATAIGDGGYDLQRFTQGGPAQYSTPVNVPAKQWFDSEAWSVDELVRPDNNPWSARTRVTGIDFYPDGNSLVVCTWDGDVWKVTGTKSLGTTNAMLQWQRIATGLFQPLGILVDGERLLCSCRDQIVSLGDANDDGEMDDYRCLNSDHQVTEHFHEFAMGLQRDSEGNLYYAKSARHAKTAVVPHHGTLLKVSPDGSRTEILATGFRAANGVCLNDDGTFIVTDQEGHWNPKNRINWVRPGGFYGNMYGYHDVTDSSDDVMEQPLCWITNAFDRSPAELLWADTTQWGPLNGSLLNLSYGYGRIFVVPHEHLSTESGDRQPQGGMCQLPIPDLPTGMIRGRFSPSDGQLYVGGMFSWAGSRQEQEGGLFKVSYKSGSVGLPIDLRTTKERIDITFSDPLQPEASGDESRYSIKVWDLKRTKQYGSKHFNERELDVVAATLLADGKTVRLEIPELKPTWGMEIVCRLKSAEGDDFRRVIHNTIHQIGER